MTDFEKELLHQLKILNDRLQILESAINRMPMNPDGIINAINNLKE